MPNISELLIGAAYIRVSTDDQTEYSPDSQLRLIREYAQREGYIIPAECVYKDDGISGRTADKRPAFRLMIAAAKENPPSFSCIFVWKYSRFARNQEEAIVYKNLLRKNGVSVRSITEPSSDSPFASLIERIIEWMDEYYCINLSAEVRRGMTEKAMRGEAMGKPPFGYSVRDKILVPNADADTVRYIFERFVNGANVRTISRELTERGIHTAKGGKLETNVVSYILRNPVYVGKLLWSMNGRAAKSLPGPGEAPENLICVDGKHEPLIPFTLWEKAQSRLLERDTGVRYVRQGKAPRMLKGLVRCSSCGATLVYQTRNALQCCRYIRGGCTTSHFVKAPAIEADVVRGLEEALTSDAFVFAPTAAPTRPPKRDWDSLTATVETRLRRARGAFLDGIFGSDEYRAVKEELERELADLRRRAVLDTAPAEPDPAVFRETVASALEFIKSPDVTDEAKNETLHGILEKIVLNRPGNRLDFYFHI